MEMERDAFVDDCAYDFTMKNSASRLPPNITDLLLDTVFLVDAKGCIVHVSAACERMFGYAAEEMIGQSMIDFVVPEDRARTVEESRHVMAGSPRIGFENRYRRKDGHPVHVMWSARWSDEDGLRVGVARDVTDQKHVNSMQAVTYAVSEAAHDGTDLAVLLEKIYQIVATLVPMSAFVVAIQNPANSRVSFAYRANTCGDVPEVPERLLQYYCSGSTDRSPPMQEQLLVRQADAAKSDCSPCDTSARWLGIPLTSPQQTIGALYMMSGEERPISSRNQALMKFVAAQVALAIERKRLKEELVRSAEYDELTGVANRRLFHGRMKSVISKCRRKRRRMALIFLDLDSFKQVNDTLGHAVGDLLLQEVARRLTNCVREEDTVARLGGDEFVVLLEEIEKFEDAAGIASKIRHMVSLPLPVNDHVLHARASLGIAVYPDDGSDVDQLLQHADKAMYREKQAYSCVLE